MKNTACASSDSSRTLIMATHLLVGRFRLARRGYALLIAICARC